MVRAIFEPSADVPGNMPWRRVPELGGLADAADAKEERPTATICQRHDRPRHLGRNRLGRFERDPLSFAMADECAQFLLGHEVSSFTCFAAGGLLGRRAAAF